MGGNIAFFINSDKPRIRSVTEQLMKIAQEQGFPSFLFDGADKSDLGELCFFAVVGGDGTVLKSVPHALAHGVAILGINAGRVGFLTEIGPSDFPAALELYKQNALAQEERMMLCCTVNGERVSYCLNDMLLYKKSFSGIAHISFTIDDNDAGSVSCDGIIAGTPTGSTGYSISAGGPIIAPGLDALVITPVCSHSLYVRPIVAAPQAKLKFTMQSEGCLYSDGQYIMDVGGDDEIVITRAEVRARFLRAGARNLFRLVKEKLY